MYLHAALHVQYYCPLSRGYQIIVLYVLYPMCTGWGPLGRNPLRYILFLLFWHFRGDRVLEFGHLCVKMDLTGVYSAPPAP